MNTAPSSQIPASAPTLKQWLEHTTQTLEGVIHNPRLAAEWLLAHQLQCTRLSLYDRYEESLKEPQISALHSMLSRLQDGEPLQYVVGETEFMGHILRCDKRALIPRPETEILVETVLNCQNLWSRTAPQVADIGTGSGCIAIALAYRQSEAQLFGVDISEPALSLACTNAAKCGLAEKIAWLEGDLLSVFPENLLDAVVANLPYIPSADHQQLPRHIKDFEPANALDGGPDGLQYISRLLSEAQKKLKPGGWIFLEIGDTQASRVIELMQRQLWRTIELSKDLSDRDRIVGGMKT